MLLVLLFSLLSLAFSSTQISDVSIPCNMDINGGLCEVDSYVGSTIIYEDDRVRIWNFTLPPGKMTSMHRHDLDYHFVAIIPSQLEVWSEDGIALYNFRAEGTLGFTVQGDFLVPVHASPDLPSLIPRTHAAKNIGLSVYNEIIYEQKPLLCRTK